MPEEGHALNCTRKEPVSTRGGVEEVKDGTLQSVCQMQKRK